MSTALGYRKDIDGLRAIAVTVVLLFHVGTPGFSGGFIGVDIFFAISGYLIGSIVFNQLTLGRFSFADFYYRRIRRLFPLYLAVVVAAGIAAFFILLPREFREFGQSIVATSLYLSNVLFYLEAGYFDTASHLKPLLHTWSLAVEEQFYLVFPTLAWLCFPLLKSRIWVAFGLLSLASLALSAWYIQYDQSAVFYLYPFRAWEMFLGVTLAAARLRAPVDTGVARLLAGCGLTLLLWPVFSYDADTLFPGVAALPACVGTLLLIHACGQQAHFISRLLSTTPMVFIGKISYSLYLWHWPVVVLYMYAYGDDLSAVQRVWLLTIIFALSVLSWRLIEQPLRATGADAHRERWPAFAAAGAASLVCIAAGLVLHQTNGLPQRLDAETARVAAVANDFFQDWSQCVDGDNADMPGVEHCIIGEPHGDNDFVLVWGDSHAFALKPGFQDLLQKNGLHAVVAWRGGCPPLWAIDKRETAASALEDRACSQQNERMHEIIRSNEHIKALVLIGRWSYYLNGGGLGIDDHNRIELSARDTAPPDMTTLEPEALFLSAFEYTVSELNSHGLAPFLVEQIPEFPEFHATTLARGMFNGSLDYHSTVDRVAQMDYQVVRTRQSGFQSLTRRLDAQAKITLLPTHRLFCSAESCSALVDGIPAYFDNNHLSSAAALEVGHIFQPLVDHLSGDAYALTLPQRKR